MSTQKAEPHESDAWHIALETKVMFLENALEAISEVVLDQGRQLERLANRVDGLLGNSTERAEGPGDARALVDDVPPHY